MRVNDDIQTAKQIFLRQGFQRTSNLSDLFSCVRRIRNVT